MSSVLKYKKRFEHYCHDGPITSVALNPRGGILAAGSLDGNVSVWAVDTGSALHRVNARTPILSLVWSTGSEGFVFGCENGILVSILLEEVHPSSHQLRSICYSPTETWEVFKTIPQLPEQYSQTKRVVKITSVNWLQSRNSSEGGQRFIVTSYLWHGVMCWDLASLAITCLSLVLTPDGSLVAAYGASDSFEVHDTKTRRLMQALPWEARLDLSSPPVAFAHEGFAIISGGQGKVSIWDVEHSDELQTLNHDSSLSPGWTKGNLVVLSYGIQSHMEIAVKAMVIRNLTINRLTLMMIGVAALLGWRWIAPI
ncbi:WD40-repeat-containing domain protein [Lactarius indigo]|nr:WD40-repeat-containing domain protein [Lactarius indigo]